MSTALLEQVMTEVNGIKSAIESMRNGGVVDKDALKAAVREILVEMAKQRAGGEPEGFDLPADMKGGVLLAKDKMALFKTIYKPSEESSLTPQGKMPWTLFSTCLPKDVADLADDLYITHFVLNSRRRAQGQDTVPMTELKLWPIYEAATRDLRKALSTSGSATGAEWIPTGFSAMLWEKVRLALRVAALHRTVDMPTNPFKLPTRGGNATGYLVAENTGDEGTTKPTSSTPGTGNITLDAVKLGARTWVSDEAEEDSIIAMLPFMRDELVYAIAEAIETATINGDTAGTHRDSDVSAANDRRKAWDGYRKKANANSAEVDFGGTSSSDSGVTSTNLRALRAKMGKYGVDPSQLAWVTGIDAYFEFLGLPEVITLDKYGPNATFLTGELGRFDGIPIVVSEAMREDLNASGVYDGSTTTKTVIVLTRRDQWVYGNRRALRLESERDIQTGQTVVVATVRMDFEALYPSDKIVAVGYDVHV